MLESTRDEEHEELAKAVKAYQEQGGQITMLKAKHSKESQLKKVKFHPGYFVAVDLPEAELIDGFE